MSMYSTRRDFLLGLIVLAASCSVPKPVLAKDDGGSSGSGGDNDDDNDDDDSGGDDSGGDDSGDDDKDDDSGNDDGGDDSGGEDNDDNSGGDDKNDDKGKDDDGKLDQDDARKAVKAGKAMPLRNAMKRAKDRTDGRIIDVGLTRKRSKFIYVFTVVKPSGRIEKLKMDASTGRFAGLFGF